MSNSCFPPVGGAKGRGAKSNATGRFEAFTRHAEDDGWGAPEEDEPAKLQTTLQAEKARKIITHNDSPDIGFNSSINPYRGCEHGCIYCFARPSHAYMGCRRAWISRPGCSSSPRRRAFWSGSCRGPAMSASASSSAPTPTPTSRSSASC
ncbi:MAG: hypothetical protein WDM92_15995 [Caulobacteraceae bacterium]